MKNFILVLFTCSALYAQTSAVALYEESQKALLQGNLNLAKDKILAAIDSDKSNEDFRNFEKKIRNIGNKLTNGNRSIQDRRFDDAISTFNEVISEVPNLLPAIHGAGKAHYYKKEFIEALGYFKKALDIDSSYVKAKKDYRNSVIGYYKSIASIKSKGEMDKAIEMYDNVLSYDPKLYQAHYQAGRIYQQKGNHSEAIKRFDKALLIDKNQPKILFQKGRSFKAIGDFDNAIQTFEQAIGLDEKYYIAYKNIGDIYLDQKNYPEAIQALNLAIKYDNKLKTTSYLSLANAYNGQNSFDKTIDLLNQDDPANKFDNDLYYWFYLASAYNGVQDCANAISASEKVIENQGRKNFGGGFYQLGVAQWCNGNGDKAKSENSMKRARNDRNFRDSAEYFITYEINASN